MARLQHFLDGKKLTRLEPASLTTARVSVLTGVEPHCANSFTSVRRAEAWIAKQPFAEAYALHQDILKRARAARASATEQTLKAYQSALVRRLRRSIGSRLRAEKVKTDDIRAVDRAMARYNPVLGPIIHSAILYSLEDYTGARLPIPGGAAYPVLGWFSFNDRTSSVRVFGSLTLHQHNWFRGTAKFFLGVPFQGFPRMSDFGFDNRASSAVSV